MLEVTPVSPPKSAIYPTDDRRERHLTLALGIVFVTMTALTGFDIAYDFQERISLKHQLVGVSVILVGLVGVAVTGRRLVVSLRRERILRRDAEASTARWRTREHELTAEAAALAEQLHATEHEACRRKREAGELLAGLGVAIRLLNCTTYRINRTGRLATNPKLEGAADQPDISRCVHSKMASGTGGANEISAMAPEGAMVMDN